MLRRALPLAPRPVQRAGPLGGDSPPARAAQGGASVGAEDEEAGDGHLGGHRDGRRGRRGGQGLSRAPGPWLREGCVVGLPRALLYYELYPFWRSFFEELGFRLVDSGPTSREVLEAGVREAVDEACLPVKAFYGHVISLRDRVDAVFLPRLVSLERGTYTCPKLLGLPDMVRHNISRLPAVITADFDETRPGKGLREAAVRLARRLGRGARLARAAVARGPQSLALFPKAPLSGLSVGGAGHG
ncbi:MAG TPA: hypothetical protein DHW14_00885, partial [Clostridiales bacterium]|nr:hypothetical protein [Clostridiales bacterium]